MARKNDASIDSDWYRAERFAGWHMRSLGFADARTTQSSQDRGIDVLATDAVAQVKHFTGSPVGAPAVQQLSGAGHGKKFRLFYSFSGYTTSAVEFANAADVVLFTYSNSGKVAGVNAAGHAMLATANLGGVSLLDYDRYLHAEHEARAAVYPLRLKLGGVRTQDSRRWKRRGPSRSPENVAIDPLRRALSDAQIRLVRLSDDATLEEIEDILLVAESAGRALAEASGVEYGPSIAQLGSGARSTPRP